MGFAAVFVGFWLGISLAAPPGPMNAIIARESSSHGWGAGMRVGMGAPVVDVLWLALFWFGLGRLLDHGWLIRSLAAAGAILMAYFAYSTIRASDTDPTLHRPPATFTAGFAMALTNPYQAAWWFTGGFVFLQTQGGYGVSGLVVGIFVWVVVFAYLVAHGARKWNWFRPTIRWFSGVVLGIFAILLVLVAAGLIEA